MPTVSPSLHQSAFRPVIRGPPMVEPVAQGQPSDTSASNKEDNSDDEVDIETTEDEPIVQTPINVAQNLHSNSTSHGRASPQCWSPPRETVSERANYLIMVFVQIGDVDCGHRCITDESFTLIG